MKCDLIDSGDSSEKDLLQNDSTNKCFESRRCENGRADAGDEPFAGYDAQGKCVCAEVAETLSYYYAEPTIRFTRQTDERDFVTIEQETRRVVRSRKGARLR